MQKALYIGNPETGQWLQETLSSTSLAIESCSTYAEAATKLQQNGQSERMPILLGMPVDADLFKFIQSVIRPCIVIVKHIDIDLLSTLREQKAAGYVVEGSNGQEVFFRIQSVIHTAEGVRKNQRVTASFRVEYRVDGSNFSASSYSLSRQGLFLVTENPLAINKDLYVRFRLSDNEPFIACSAKVSYVVKKEEGKTAAYPNGMAVVFVGIKNADQQRIDAYIRQLDQG